MNAFTPAEPAPYDVSTFNHPVFQDLELGEPEGQRHDGWTPEKQKLFLTALSRGHNVTQACATVGMSRQNAYALRNSARGAAFALGWKAALMRARDCLADELMDRAFNGVRESVTSPDGRITTRHRHDNALAMRMLARLDRRADTVCTEVDAAAVRLAAADFEQYLDLVAQAAGPGRAGLFLAARMGAAGVKKRDDLAPIRTLARADRWLRTGVDDSQGIDTSDLDPACRADWTAEQWARAEAAGLVVLAKAKPEEEEHPLLAELREAEAYKNEPVYMCPDAEEWRTRFPPPPDFDGWSEGQPGDDDYLRGLTEEEEAALNALEAFERAPAIAEGNAARAQWLAECAAAAAALKAQTVAPQTTPNTNPPPPGRGGTQSVTEGEDSNEHAVQSPTPPDEPPTP
ncbi:MAG: hypothetical protein CVT77_09990 [Alphaproteobacteria bacterium HGW-Alphaproteobacteria-16]|nr:MAG: hypothetical protein CVT77_09990 [Alphaproteobacteria bacterium HGW-Alphaproteobacteria-16]